MNEMSSRTNTLSPESDVSATYERVIEGASIVSELDRIEQKQQTIECLLESNRELVQQVGVWSQKDP